MTRTTSDRREWFDPLEPRTLLAGDDHPDLSEFPAATVMEILPWAQNVMMGADLGRIEVEGDTDVFKFTVPQGGGAGVIWLLQSASEPGELQPRVELRNSAGQLLDAFNGVNGAAYLGSDPPVGNGLIPFVPGETYWIVARAASPGPWAGSTNGGYQVAVFMDGPGGSGFTGGGGGSGWIGGGGSSPPPPGAPPDPPDDAPDAGEWSLATSIPLLSGTGDGSHAAAIGVLTDSDLFRFDALGAGPTYVTVSTPAGSLLQPMIRVYDSEHHLVTMGTDGIPGMAAAVSWNAMPGERYFVIVESRDGSTGGYTLHVGAQPATHHLYYPEGYSSATISEFIALANPGPHTVHYTITARYEWGDRDQVIESGSISPWSRGGVTIVTRGQPGSSLVRLGVPYALEIASDGPLAASLSHYDFGISTGESFTEQASTSWTFTEAHRVPGFRDFLVWHNPSDTDAAVTITLYYEDGFEHSFVRTVGALRRGGIALATDPMIFRPGVFAMRVESSVPIVAALTSYEVAGGRGYGVLGDPLGGSSAGVIPQLSSGGPDSSITVFNGGSAPAMVTFSWDYTDGPGTGPMIQLEIAPARPFRLSLAYLGVDPDRLVGVRYTSTAPVTVAAREALYADADAAAAATQASTIALFGDAYVNPAAPSLYRESLGIYNPAGQAVQVRLTYLFNDGTTASREITVGADAFRRVSLQSDPLILQRGVGTPFSIMVQSNSPVVSALTHYDLYINGGWASLGSWSGFVTPLAGIM